MKKLSLFVAVALAVGFSSCSGQSSKGNLENSVDSLSYAIGMARTQGLDQFLMQQGIDSAHVVDFVKGFNEGATKLDSKDAAYIIGLQVGQMVSKQWVEGFNRQIFGNDSTQTLSREQMLAGFVAGTLGREDVMTRMQAQTYMSTEMDAIREKTLAVEFADNKAAGEKFLAENKTKEGVQTTPSGLQYKIITKGNGPVPADTNRVQVNYRGTLIDGTEFDSSYKRKDRDYAGTRFYYNLSEINNGISNIDDIFNTESYFSEKNFEDGKVSIMKLKQPRDSYTSGSDIASGYVTAEVYPIRNLLLNLGLRYEMSKQFVNYHNDQSQLERRELNNHDLFPAINSKYSINEENNLRLSFSRTITRPTFIEMAPFLYEESYGSAQIRGNENLKNGYNYNVDLRYEMINKNGNMISATAYYKFLETPIERTQQIAGGATMHSFNNADNGMAAGIELEIRQAITKDLQVGANGSYMYTNVVLPEGGAYTNTNRALQGASPYLANADITYKHDFKNKQQINFALLYNLQGPRIHSVGVSGLGDITQRPVHTLNLVAGYQINDRVNISLKASDLLNNDIVFEQDVPLTGELIEVERFKKGMKIEIGISYQIK